MRKTLGKSYLLLLWRRNDPTPAGRHYYDSVASKLFDNTCTAPESAPFLAMAYSFFKLSPVAQMRCAISSVGYLGIIGALKTPAESVISMQSAINVALVGYGVFTAQFLLVPDFFYSENL